MYGIRLVILTGREIGYSSALKEEGSRAICHQRPSLWKDTGRQHLADLGWILYKARAGDKDSGTCDVAKRASGKHVRGRGEKQGQEGGAKQKVYQSKSLFDWVLVRKIGLSRASVTVTTLP